MCIKRRKGQITKEAMEKMNNKRVPLKDSDVDELQTIKGY